MALTLAQLAKVEREPLRAFVLMNLLRAGNVMEFLPFENVDALRSVSVRWTSLPEVGWRGINEGYDRSEGQYEQMTEAVYGFGGEFEFDRVFEKIKNTIKDPIQDQMEMKLKSMQLTFNDYFINGSHLTDPDGIVGVKERIDSHPSRQTVWAAGSSAAALDPTASVANARAFLKAWNQAHYRCNRGNVGAIIVNEGTYWGFADVLTYIGVSGGNILDVTRDTFEREIVTYKGAPMIDIGLKKDQLTEIITETEIAGDAGADATSAYFLSFDINEGITGIQLGPLEVYDPLNGGESETKPTKLKRLDWWNGLAGFGSYGMVRLRNFEGASNWT